MSDPRPGGTADKVLDWFEHLSGPTKSATITIVNLIPLKPDSPYSVALLKHYVEASGKLYEFSEVPKDWQEWIVKETGGTLGSHKDLSPYNSGIYDLRNSLGHFDVNITKNKNGTETYFITDVYQFGYQRNDRGQRGRHGFPLGSVDNSTLDLLRRLLPSKEYTNPGGFGERFEIKKVGKETFLFIPQQFLAQVGRSFPVKGNFTR